MLKLEGWMKQLSIRKKIFISQLCIIMIPITLLGTVAYVYYSRMINDKVISLLYQNNEQMVNNIDIILENTSRLSERPFLDGTISEILKRDYVKVDPSMRNYQKIIDRNLVTESIYRGIIYANSYVQSVEMLMENTHDIFCVGTSVVGNISSYEQIIKEPWYQEIVNSEGIEIIMGSHSDHYLSRDREFVSVGRNIILDPLSHQSDGIIKINIRVENLQKILEKFNSMEGILTVLIDGNGQIICSNGLDSMTEQEISKLLPQNHSEKFHQDVAVIEGKKYIRCISTSGYSDWKMVNMIPEKELFAETDQFGSILVTIGFILFFVLICVSYITSRSITKPIIELKSNLKELQNGNLDVRSEVEGGEMGDLAATFNNMASQMQSFLDEIYTKETEKRNAELLALQAQINPHFFYNTLRAIRWMADVQGACNVVDALDELVGMLRAVAHMQGDLVTIEEDLQIIKLYSEILMIRYMDRFKVEYHIDEDLKEYRTIKFLLQPILENSIFHGFDENNEEGLISVTVRSCENVIIFEVKDNGKGMDDATIKRVLTEESVNHRGLNKIGIFNVNNRIKLTFGEDYGIQIESVLGEYTLVRATIPMVKG